MRISLQLKYMFLRLSRAILFTVAVSLLIYALTKTFLPIQSGVNLKKTRDEANSQVLGATERNKLAKIPAYVRKIVDGDTIELEDGTRIRYIGMDTPEIGMPFYKEAKAENAGLVEGKNVELEFDLARLDKYGRNLAYVYIGNIMVNKYLIEQGLATIMTVPPNVKYQSEFLKAQKAAKKNCQGLWRSICQK